MNAKEILANQPEYAIVSDLELKPTECVSCGWREIIRRTHKFFDRQDLGTPKRKRIQRHEWILFECKKCGTQFTIFNPNISIDTRYTDDVKEYVFKRVLEKGDSMHRVSSDLKDLHNVDLAVQTISEWIMKKKEGGKRSPPIDQRLESGPIPTPERVEAISLDGTFRAVNPKKNDPGKKKGGPSCLHITRLKSGQLVAYWESGSEETKQLFS